MSLAPEGTGNQRGLLRTSAGRACVNDWAIRADVNLPELALAGLAEPGGIDLRIDAGGDTSVEMLLVELHPHELEVWTRCGIDLRGRLAGLDGLVCVLERRDGLDLLDVGNAVRDQRPPPAGGILRLVGHPHRRLDGPVLHVGVTELARELLDRDAVTRMRLGPRLGKRGRVLVGLDGGLRLHLARGQKDRDCHDRRDAEIHESELTRHCSPRHYPYAKGSG